METYVLVLLLSISTLQMPGVRVNATAKMTVGEFNSLKECLADKAIKEPDLEQIDDPEVEVQSFECIKK